jgi:hypothetical protein
VHCRVVGTHPRTAEFESLLVAAVVDAGRLQRGEATTIVAAPHSCTEAGPTCQACVDAYERPPAVVGTSGGWRIHAEIVGVRFLGVTVGIAAAAIICNVGVVGTVEIETRVRVGEARIFWIICFPASQPPRATLWLADPREKAPGIVKAPALGQSRYSLASISFGVRARARVDTAGAGPRTGDVGAI